MGGFRRRGALLGARQRLVGVAESRNECRKRSSEHDF